MAYTRRAREMAHSIANREHIAGGRCGLSGTLVGESIANAIDPSHQHWDGFAAALSGVGYRMELGRRACPGGGTRRPVDWPDPSHVVTRGPAVSVGGNVGSCLSSVTLNSRRAWTARA